MEGLEGAEILDANNKPFVGANAPEQSNFSANGLHLAKAVLWGENDIVNFNHGFSLTGFFIKSRA